MTEKREDKLIEWLNMDYDEKRKYNGFEGFVSGKLFKDNNLFMKEDCIKLEKRREKEKNNRKKLKCKEGKNGRK